MSDLSAADLELVQKAIELLDEAGFDVQGVDGVETAVGDGPTRWQLTVAGETTAEPEPAESVQESDDERGVQEDVDGRQDSGRDSNVGVAEPETAGGGGDADSVFACDVGGCEYVSGSEHGLSIHKGHVHADGDGAEDQDHHPDQGDVNEQVWCGVCGAGSFDSTTALSGHHAGASHEGDTQPVASAPEEANGSEQADGAQEPDTTASPPAESLTDGGAAAASSDTAASATCQNCGSQVTADYARVFTPDGEDDPRACPNCDKIRERDGTVREPRSAAHRTEHGDSA